MSHWSFRAVTSAGGHCCHRAAAAAVIAVIRQEPVQHQDYIRSDHQLFDKLADPVRHHHRDGLWARTNATQSISLSSGRKLRNTKITSVPSISSLTNLQILCATTAMDFGHAQTQCTASPDPKQAQSGPLSIAQGSERLRRVIVAGLGGPNQLENPVSFSALRRCR